MTYSQSHVDSMRATIERLSAELDNERRKVQILTIQRRRYVDEVSDLTEQADRVRDVLDGKAEEPDSPEFIEGYNLALSNIRAALEGEQ